MASKAQLPDAHPGRTLWLKEHKIWVPVVVEAVIDGGKGPKVTFRRSDGTQGKQTLAALYRRPTT